MSDDQSQNGGGTKRTFKIVLLGDQGVGKTSIISRFTSNKFRKNQNPTQGVDFFGKNVVHDSKNHRLQLWDTSGNERYRKLIPNYLKDAACGLFIYDRTDLTTLENLQNWIKIFQESHKQKAIMAFCENKNDLPFSLQKNRQQNGDKSEQQGQQENKQQHDRILFNEKVKQIQQKYKITHFSVSALANKQIHSMFHDLIDQIKQKSLNTSGSANRIKQLIQKQRIKYKLEQRKAQEKQVSQPTNAFITQQSTQKTNSMSTFQLSEPIDFDNKSLHLNNGKGKRKRKVHKVNNIPTNQTHDDDLHDDLPIDQPPSIWSKICPCLFK